MTRFLDVHHLRQLCARIGIASLLREIEIAIETEFCRWESFDKSSRLAQYSPHGVIELMPIADHARYSFKYVNGHPGNPRDGLPTVMAFGVLADVRTGMPLLLSEMTLTTALRTAATSVLAARCLARADAHCMAIIGNGAQSEFQALAFHHLLGVHALRLYDIDPAATHKLAHNLCTACGAHALDVTLCHSAREAAAGADIVTTLTAAPGRMTVLSRDMLTPGTHINAVGGDSPGKTELHQDIVETATIFVEYLPQTQVEGEIQGRSDIAVTELWRVLTGAAPGRRDAHQITVFDSVGFALEDFAALRVLHDLTRDLGIGDRLELVATPHDPKNLFELLSDAPSKVSAGEVCAPAPCM